MCIFMYIYTYIHIYIYIYIYMYMNSHIYVHTIGGSGGVGTFAVQIAKHYLRCHTTATCSSINKELVKKLGVYLNFYF